MNESESAQLSDQTPVAQRAIPRQRVIGSPLPMGVGRRPSHSADDRIKRLTPPPPGRGLTVAESPTDEPSSGVQRAMNAFRSALPFVQRLLPLLDGNFATAITNMLTPHVEAHAPAPKVDLAPLEDSLAQLQAQHRDLHDQVLEQNNSLKRVEDQLEMVREATDRNTLEQQELLEDLKNFGNKVKLVAVVALGVLAIGIIVNLVLYMKIQRVLP